MIYDLTILDSTMLNSRMYVLPTYDFKVYHGISKNRGDYYKFYLIDRIFVGEMKFILDHIDQCKFYLYNFNGKKLDVSKCKIYIGEQYKKTTMNEQLTFHIKKHLHVELSKKLYTKFKLKF